ncbi:hypothetical protein V5O48_011120 [Marasmius crinis-equi]|uniref:Mucoidy inhibitor A n=1 Tax=Marasmius crinis-equi TaxID=585013 RepID=A0ABR3F6G6_9AGAR
MPNDIQLDHTESSKITAVSLYGSRAEITRSFKLLVKEGQNNVQIEGLPWALINDSLRVEGRGSATIHDVNMSEIETESKPPTSPALDELLVKKTRTEKALERCNKSIAALESFLGTVQSQFVKSNELDSVIKDYDVSAGHLDDKAMELKKELEELEEKITEERKKIAPKTHQDLGYRVSVGVVAKSEAVVELVLIYAVSEAGWKAAYDIRVDTSGKTNPVKLIYKSVITNSTKEAWNDVPLTLETATPTFGVNLPNLDQWTLSAYRPHYPMLRAKKASMSLAPAMSRRAQMDTYDPTIEDSYGGAAVMMDYATTEVTSKGSISATFRVPGLVTIPADEGEHTFTIVELELEAGMTWYAVPKVDTRVHLKAKIKNNSEYALLAGTTSVYVDGSFISKSDMPAVSPQESFDCPLGLDQSVRITYHPISKKSTTSGLYIKSTSYVYIQRLTVHNTKTIDIPFIKIVDQIPVSEDSAINVKLVSPGLKLPGGGAAAALESSAATLGKSSSSSAKKSDSTVGHTRATSVSVADVIASSAGPSVKVANGIMAQWDGADEESVDGDALGRDGKVNWLCEVPAGEKVNLNLQWEVSMPVKMRVSGL